MSSIATIRGVVCTPGAIAYDHKPGVCSSESLFWPMFRMPIYTCISIANVMALRGMSCCIMSVMFCSISYHIIDELKSSSNAIINRKYLLDGLEKIKTRGYDGAGIATMSPRQGQMVR